MPRELGNFSHIILNDKYPRSVNSPLKSKYNTEGNTGFTITK